MSTTTNDPVVTSREAYEAAMTRWQEASKAAQQAAAAYHVAEKAAGEASDELAQHEAYPGVPSWIHAPLDAKFCRVGYQCAIHTRDDEEPPF